MKGTAVAGAVFVLIGLPSFYSAFVVDLAGRDKQISEGQTVAKGAVSEDAEKRWIFVTNWSLPPSEVAEAMFPRINGDTSCVLTQALGTKAGTGVRPYTGAIGRPLNAREGNYRQHSLYIGFITCLFALLSLACLVRNKLKHSTTLNSYDPDVVFFAISALVFVAFACGRYFEPVYRLVYMLPFGDYLRAPVKWYHLFEFCVVVLAGFGIDAAYEKLKKLNIRNFSFFTFHFSFAAVAVAVLVLIGVFDIVRVDHKFCAPVDMSSAKAKNAEMQMTFLPKQQFNNPQVVQMMQAGLIKSLAYYPGRNDIYLVGILKPRGPRKDSPMPPWTLPTWLGVVSLVTSLFVISYSSAKLLKSEFFHRKC